ncbi:MAG: hypothetical protein JSS43_19015, partial [Proteobacteria bacterium]|nr:hypothetical protein [Pseudomonadota bacterium]
MAIFNTTTINATAGTLSTLNADILQAATYVFGPPSFFLPGILYAYDIALTATISAAALTPITVGAGVSETIASGAFSLQGGMALSFTGAPTAFGSYFDYDANAVVPYTVPAGELTLSGANQFTGGVTIGGGILDLASTTAAGTGAIGFAANATAMLRLEAGVDPANAIQNFDQSDSIDLIDVAPGQAAPTYTGGVLSYGGVSLTLATPTSGVGFGASSDKAGGTL